jgi:arylsulfatase A-like enzyme
MRGDRLNILLITSDQQHWNTLGFLNPEVRTPHLDRLAREGTACTRAYCPNPTCSPTRASMITGMYPSQHGCWSLGTKLPESAHTFGQDLTAAGFRTALIGKAHFQPLRGTEEFPSLEAYPVLQDLDFWRGYHGPFYGFERVELARNHADEAHVGQHYVLWMLEQGFTDWPACFQKPTGTAEKQYGRWNLPEEFHYDRWIAERTCALMEEYRERDESFLLWASFFDPHPPYLVPEPWDTLYDPEALTVPSSVPGEHDRNPPHFRLTQQEKPDFSSWRESGQGIHGCHSHLRDREKLKQDVAIYYGMISLMDRYIGRILDRLDALGLAENTLVLFTSDHGHFFGHHGLIAKGPFHYEDLIRIPFIVRCPGRVPAGERTSALQSLVDLAPSLLTVAGVPVPRPMTGVDQSEVWFGRKERARTHVVVENRHEPTTLHLKTYVDERYKLTVYYNREYGELFDLAEDPGEVRNLWDEPACRELRCRLVRQLLDAEMGKEPLWMPRVSGA